MAKNRRIIYWDTCVFLAWLQGEARAMGEMEGVAEVVELINNNRVELATSVITAIEVLQSSLSPENQEKFSSIFKRPNIKRISVDVRIAELAHYIRDYYRQTGTGSRRQTQSILQSLFFITQTNSKPLTGKTCSRLTEMWLDTPCSFVNRRRSKGHSKDLSRFNRVPYG